MGRPLRAAHSNDAAESPSFSLLLSGSRWIVRADASLASHASHIPALPRTRALGALPRADRIALFFQGAVVQTNDGEPASESCILVTTALCSGESLAIV